MAVRRGSKSVRRIAYGLQAVRPLCLWHTAPLQLQLPLVALYKHRLPSGTLLRGRLQKLLIDRLIDGSSLFFCICMTVKFKVCCHAYASDEHNVNWLILPRNFGNFFLSSGAYSEEFFEICKISPISPLVPYSSHPSFPSPPPLQN